jgi:phenylacetate-CoA ligase
MLKERFKKTEPFDDLDRLDAAGLERWWVGRLRRVLQLAAEKSPFYRERFEAAGFDPSRFRTLADLRAAPIISKSDLLAAQRKLGRSAIGIELDASAPNSRVTMSLSSGTSGTTFVTHTAPWRRMQGRSSSRAHWWAGLRRGSPLILSAPAWHAYASIQPAIAMHFRIPCMVMSGTLLPRFAERFIDAIVRFRPRFVTMFLPMVFSVLAAARRMNMDGDRLFAGVETLVVTGAPITPGMRAHLAQLTGVSRVAEIAGSSENLLAVDCAEARGLHVVPDTCHAEVIDRKSGEPVADLERGSIVHSSVIPSGSLYLRYDGGDAGVIDHSPCRCGLPSPRIKLLGRWEDSFSLGAQRLLPYDIQFALEQEMPELNGSTCVITREGLADAMLRLLVIGPEKSTAAILNKAQERLARRFDVRVEIAAVRDLPLRFKGVPPILSEQEAASAV